MSVLLIRLAGPMQSWGTQSRFGVRDTGREPSKSGVIGLLCAALGRPRDQPVEDLAALRMGVRVNADGIVRKDFHTAQDVIRADGSGRAETVVSTRYYLSDASFLVGLESADRAILDRLDAALRHPVWPLSLGRKSFVPGTPVAMEGSGVFDGPLFDVLRDCPPGSAESRRYVVDVSYGSDPTAEPRFDFPVSFDRREFRTRHVRVEFFPPTLPAATEA